MKKTIFATICILLFAGVMMTGCKKEHEVPAPIISKIRANTPAPNDSTLTKVLPGQTVVIQGSGLSNVAQIYFNGYPTPFNSALGTDNNLVVTVPPDMPFATLRAEDLNKIRLVATDGKETIFRFPVVPPAPVISAISNEFPNPAGERVTITGTYLYLVEEIIFPGGVNGTDIVTTTDGTKLEVTIPAGVTEAGGIEISTAGGVSNSHPAVVLNDDAHVFYDFDAKNAYASWNNPAKPVVRTPADPYAQIPFLRGNYIHWMASDVAPGTWWMQDLATPSDGSKLVYANDIDLDEPALNLSFKFEINVPGEGLKDGRIEFNFGWTYIRYWEPAKNGTFATNGWRTITIPLAGFVSNGAPAAKYNDIKGRAFNMFFVNGDGKVTTNVDIGWDNFRIVKIK